MASTSAVGSSISTELLASLNGSKNTTTSTDAKSAEEIQNRFLTLLVTQLKNQDPMNPMDNSQMTSQLAQISTVQGIEKLNSTIQSLVDGATANQTIQAAALVGREVLVPGSGLTLANGSARGGIELSAAADKVTVTISDANGRAVRTLELDGGAAGTMNFTWDGKTDSGASATDGQYSVKVEATETGQKVSAEVLQYGKVNGVARGASGITLSLASGNSFVMGDIKQIN